MTNKPSPTRSCVSPKACHHELICSVRFASTAEQIHSGYESPDAYATLNHFQGHCDTMLDGLECSDRLASQISS